MGGSTRDDSVEFVRLDRWLWAARMFRSRTLAAAACDGGKVRVNDAAAKPHKPLRIGDRLSIATERGSRRLRVEALSERRGPAGSARQLYEDLTPPAPPPTAREPPPVTRERGSGRPTKRDRRRIEQLRW